VAFLRPARRAGFTLAEMIVTLLIIGLVMGISVMGVNALTAARLREESGRLAAVIRGVYALAATNGRTYRIVFDIDGGRYHVEFTDDPVLLEQERARAVEGRKVEEEKRPKGGSLLGIGPSTPTLPKPGWQRAPKGDIGLLEGDKEEIKLHGDVQLEGVFTAHQVDVFTKGRTELYFFPSGWTEPAMIYLKEKGEKGEVFTVEVDALTGRATIHNSKVPVPSEYLEDRAREEEGERIF
jgi:prepilin-type N-terminal cleavage/methylation domain-containing protein